MWLGEHCFGRADQKESLLKSLERQQQPPQSFHWREVHRQRFEHSRKQKDNTKEDKD
jgi:cell division FtsZ-interacting protein ZapD